MACLTALTHLDLGDSEDSYVRNASDFNVSDEGARQLATLVRLTYFDLSSSLLSDETLKALCSLTALTYLDLGSVSSVHPFSDEAVCALGSLTSLTHLDVMGTIMSDEAFSELEDSLDLAILTGY